MDVLALAMAKAAAARNFEPIGAAAAARGAGLAPSDMTMLANASASGHTWASFSGTVNLNDTTKTGLIGSQTVKLTSNGAGGLARIQNTLAAPVSFAGKSIVVWLELDDVSKTQSLQMYLATDATMTNYFLFDVDRFIDPLAQSGVPLKVTVPWAGASSTGTPDRANIGYIRLSLVDKSTGAVNLSLAGVGAQREPAEGFAVFTWDDAYGSQTSSQAVLDRYAMPATYFPIVEAVGASGSLTVANLQKFQDAGCEVGCHSMTFASHAATFNSLSASALAAEFAGMRAWAATNGFLAGMTTIAYPLGTANATVRTAARSYFTAARTTVGATKETLPPADALRIRALSLNNTTTLATAKLYVDAAKAAKSLVVFTGHKIGATADSITWTTADLTSLTDYIAAQGVQVRTLGAALR